MGMRGRVAGSTTRLSEGPCFVMLGWAAGSEMRKRVIFCPEVVSLPAAPRSQALSISRSTRPR